MVRAVVSDDGRGFDSDGNAQIASRLCITEATVKRHLTNIYAKLDAVSRVDAVRKATAARLIKPVPQAPVS
ncbi:helix-turn-helix domain-containing protein [Solwaraspora sp. WMMB762]|uniref:helix-turn-helix domain-containing protein n=1 Tax=Solwaraspora sp. WMMB762 TaxID=3404120 RepID=UPI003B950832